MTKGKKAILALCLLVPVSSLGNYLVMIVFPDSLTGTVLFALSKIWIFGMPVTWLLCVEKDKISLSPALKGGFVTAVVSGLLISAVIIAVYRAIGHRIIDIVFLRGKLVDIGLGSRAVYAGAAAYWILVNSVLEEYVWRWFCVRQCETLLRPWLAAVCSGLFFTFHHIVAMQVYFGPAAVLVCGAGVFIGGLIWSAMYIRYRSIWPGYLSHAIVDLCIFGIGASVLWG